MIPVRYHSSALEEIIQGAEYYEAKVDRLGQRFLDEVERCVSEIAAAPERWPTFLLNTRRRLLDRFPYTLVYFRAGDQIYILAAMHQKRRPGYWRKRLNWPAR